MRIEVPAVALSTGHATSRRDMAKHLDPNPWQRVHLNEADELELMKIDGIDMLTLQPTVANTYTNLMWTCAVVNFTATSTTTTIALESGNPNNGGVYLDSFTLR